MQSALKLILLLLILTISTTGSNLPFDLKSHSHQKSLLIKLQVDADQQFKIRNNQLTRNDDVWTTISTMGSQRILSSPEIPHGITLYNQKHDEKYVISTYDEHDQQKLDPTHHFNLLSAQINHQTVQFLLPMLPHELPALKTTKLFKCHNTLVSVQWINNDARIVAISKSTEQWRLVQNIDDGYASEQGGIRYAYAIDKGHTHPVVIDMGDNQYCSIDRNTPPAVVNRTWNQNYYSFNEVINSVGPALPLIQKQTTTEEL